MVRFVFTVEDLARTRFAVSPLFELVSSLLALRDPSTAALHLPWLKSLSGRLDGIALEPAVALIAPRGYSPDFINPPPASPLGDIADDLDALRATPDDLIRHDIALWKSQHAGVSVGAWLDDPRGTVEALADTLEAYWEVAMAPVWPRVRAFLEADVAHRARRLAEGGQAALFADLHPAVRWTDGGLEVQVSRHEAVKELAGRGLLLMPSVFKWDGPSTLDLAPWQPTVSYPARGIATLWDAGSAAPDGLARVLGATRAAILSALDAPRSTTELAERMDMTPPGVSHHLIALRDAGLVTARRDGRAVLYVRTPPADALL